MVLVGMFMFISFVGDFSFGVIWVCLVWVGFSLIGLLVWVSPDL